MTNLVIRAYRFLLVALFLLGLPVSHADSWRLANELFYERHSTIGHDIGPENWEYRGYPDQYYASRENYYDHSLKYGWLRDP